jgi:hypothetical protein
MHFARSYSRKSSVNYEIDPQLGGRQTPGWMRDSIFDIEWGVPARVIQGAHLDEIHDLVKGNSVLVVKSDIQTKKEKQKTNEIYAELAKELIDKKGGVRNIRQSDLDDELILEKFRKQAPFLSYSIFDLQDKLVTFGLTVSQLFKPAAITVEETTPSSSTVLKHKMTKKNFRQGGGVRHRYRRRSKRRNSRRHRSKRHSSKRSRSKRRSSKRSRSRRNR